MSTKKISMAQTPENQLADAEIVKRFEEEQLKEILSHPQLVSQDLPTANTLDLLEDIWSSDRSVVKNLKLCLGAVSKYNAKKRNNETIYKICGQLKIDILNLLKQLEFNEILGQQCSNSNFCKFLQEQKLFMTFTKDFMTEEIYADLLAACKEHIMGLSSLCANMETSTTLSTITKEVNADVPQSHNFPSTSAGGGLDALFAPTTSIHHTGGISQHICKPANGKLHSLRSPGETGYQVIRLDVYNYSDIFDKDKRQWWKHASIRTQFITSSPADRKQQLMMQLLDQAVDDVKKIPGMKKEVKDISYWNS